MKKQDQLRVLSWKDVGATCNVLLRVHDSDGKLIGPRVDGVESWHGFAFILRVNSHVTRFNLDHGQVGPQLPQWQSVNASTPGMTLVQTDGPAMLVRSAASAEIIEAVQHAYLNGNGSLIAHWRRRDDEPQRISGRFRFFICGMSFICYG